VADLGLRRRRAGVASEHGELMVVADARPEYRR